LQGQQAGSELSGEKPSWQRSAFFFFFNSLQGLGESPNLNLCDLNDFFEDFSSLSSLAHLSFYVTLLLSLVGEKNQE
jgi:hypothetical protein